MSLVERSVADFLSAVASEQEPVPAGACSAALTGALSAALVMLVCRVLRKRRHPPNVGNLLVEAERLVTRLSELIDADAAAFEAYTAAQGQEHGPARDAALADATRTPLDIAAGCIETVGLARSLAPLATRSVRSDAMVAERLADAAARAALDTAGANLATLADSPHHQALLEEWESLRSRLL